MFRSVLSRTSFWPLLAWLLLSWQTQALGQEINSQEPPLPLKLTPLPAMAPEEETIAPLEIELPHSPSDVANADADADAASKAGINASTTPIKGQAQRNLISGRARLLKENPLSKYSGPKLNFVEVHLKNNGSEPLIVRGEEAQALTEEGAVACVLAKKLVADNNHSASRQDKLAVAGISVLSLGLAAPITWEVLNPSEYRKRNLGCAVGRDGGRHEVEAELLGRQVVLPQDETRAWLAFPAKSGQIKAINLPLLIPPFPNVSGNVTIPLK